MMSYNELCSKFFRITYFTLYCIFFSVYQSILSSPITTTARASEISKNVSLDNATKYVIGEDSFQSEIVTYPAEEIYMKKHKDVKNNDFEYLIVGGYAPREPSYTKFTVSIQFSSPEKYFGDNHICAGTIYKPDIILTAAHCLVELNGSKLPYDEITVVAGTPNRLVKVNSTQVHKVSRTLLHSQYKRTKLKYDIGLIYLTIPLNIDKVTTDIVDLPSEELKDGDECTVIGWGTIYDKGPLADEILYVDLHKKSLSVCRKHYAMKILAGMICANDDDLFKDSCNGDSGGPLFAHKMQYGIVSFGSECGSEHPGVYTDVYFFKKWILDPSNSCTLQPDKCLTFFQIYFMLVLGNYIV